MAEVEKNSLIALPGKGGHRGIMPSKLSPYLGGWFIVRSFIVKVQRKECDQLMDFLLVGWREGTWESASSTFWFQPVWGLCACGQHAVKLLLPGGGSVSAKQLTENGSEYYL